MSELHMKVCETINPDAAAPGPGKAASAGAGGVEVCVPGRGARSGCNGLWRCGNVILPIVAAMGLAATAAGAGTQPQAGPALIDPAEALGTYRTVADWVDQWEAPPVHPLPEGASGAWVAIRWAGRLMGTGYALDPARLDRPELSALPSAVRLAMHNAVEAAEGFGDALEMAQRREMFLESPLLTTELQLAHSPRRIRVTRIESVIEAIRPGLDGLLVRKGDASWAIFPGQTLAMDQTAGEALLGLLVAADLGVGEFNTGIADGTIRAWTFEATHLAQGSRGGAPTFLHRGSRVVPLASVSEAEIRLAVERLADYIMRSTLAWPPGTEESDRVAMLLGDYLPSVDQHVRPVANVHDQALAALALARFASTPGVDPTRAAQAREMAVRLLCGLAEGPAADGRSLSEASAAMILIARRELDLPRGASALDEVHDRATDQVARVTRMGSEGMERLAPEDRGLCALALRTREAADEAWARTAPNVQPLLMPWIAWAELELAGPDGRIAAEAALVGLRSRVWQTQVGADALTNVAEDLVGGLVYRAGRQPDWRTANLVALQAMMLADDRLTTPDRRLAEVARLSRSVRFLLQLTVREADGYRLRDPSRALGGVREALDSQRMPAAAGPMTLLALTETMRTLDRIALER